jgi:hypothetical protein
MNLASIASISITASALLVSVLLVTTSGCASVRSQEAPRTYANTTAIPEGITTPDRVETSIGTLTFDDGAPTRATADRVYDYLDTMRGADVFLKGMPAASFHGVASGIRSQGVVEAHQVMVMDKLLDSKPLFLTGNTSTMYVVGWLDLERDGPTVVDMPPGALAFMNDAWFRFVENMGVTGPDKGAGGKYLVLPPGYQGDVPDGYYNVRSRTYNVWVFVRVSIADGLPAAQRNVEDNLRIYPLARAENPPAMQFISGSAKAFNTVHTNDFQFYEHLNEVVQKEPIDSLDPETRGLFASIGIEKGKPFRPDARMKRILTDAVKLGNAAARSLVWYPRTSGTLEGVQLYPGSDSAWVMAYADKNVFFNGPDGHTMNTDARAFFHYVYTGVTPAMAVTVSGKGSDYGIAFVDADKQPFDGSKTYKLHLPPNVPVNNFWAVTIYDNQTRSLLQTDQAFPTLGSQTKGVKQNEDGSYDIYFAPQPPEGHEGNWVQTIPGKGWFTILRMYGPLDPWINKTWRPSEIEKVN